MNHCTSFLVGVLAIWVTAAAQAGQPKAAILTCDLPGHSTALIDALAEQLQPGYAVKRIDLEHLLQAEGLLVSPPDLLVLPNAAVIPAHAAPNIEAFLRTGGDLIALRAPLSLHPLILVEGQWRHKEDYLAEQAAQPPPHVLYDLAAGLDGWARSTNHPEWTTTWTAVQGQPAEGMRAVHVRISDLEGWDTFQAPGHESAFPPGHTLTVLAARGTARTRNLSVEWEEKDGSRWIAVVPLSQDYRRIVIAPDEFRYWPSNPRRGGANDRFNPVNAAVLRIGMAFSHTGPVRGPHEYWLGPIGTAVRTPVFDQLIGDFSLPALDTICPSYKMFDCNSVATLMSLTNGSDLLESAVPRRVRSPHPRPGAGGYNKGRTWRWVPLMEARTGDNQWRGTPATLLIHADGPYKHGMWASVGIDDDDWYLSGSARDLVNRIGQRMRDQVAILDAGADKYTYFDDQPIQFGARVVNLDEQPFEGSVELVLVDRQHGEVTHRRTWPLLMAAGEVMNVSETFTPTTWAAGGYDCTVALKRGNDVLDEVRHDVHVWKPKPPAERQYMTIENGNFMLDGKRWRAHGINYMPSSGIGTEDQLYFEHWTGRRSYDPVVIQRDLENIKRIGYNSVSVFTDHRLIEAQNIVDLIRRCDDLGLKVNLSLRPGAPMNFQWPKIREMIEALRLTESDALFAYDLAWEPHFGRHGDRVRWDGDWEAWIVERYGSIENAEKDWEFATPRDAAGKITNPSAEQVMTDGPWRRMVAAYRRFLDTLLYDKYAAARRLVRSIDPHHFVSFRMTEAGNPTCRWDGIMPYDFPYLVHAVDFLAPEAYGRIGDWEQVKPGWFQLEYGRWADPDKPFIWAEQGMSTWSPSTSSNSPELLKRQADFYREFYRMMIASGADGIYSWWYPGGFRYNENSDYGIINPDGSDRPVTRIIREMAKPFLEGPDPKPIDTWIEFDRDAHADGIAGVYDAVKDEFWAAIEEGKTPGLRTAGTGTTSRTCPRVAVGNTPATGRNPLKYLDAAFDFVEYQRADGRWRRIDRGETIKSNGCSLRLQVGFTNLGEAAWTTGSGHAAAPESLGAVFLKSTIDNLPVWHPLPGDVPRGKSVDGLAVSLALAENQDGAEVTLTFEAAGCGRFGPRFKFKWIKDDGMVLSDEAMRIHRDAIVIDGHNDLPWKIRKLGDSSFEKMDISRHQEKCQTDIPRLRKGGVDGQFFAVYVPSETARTGEAASTARERFDLIHQMVKRYPDAFALARTADDVERIAATKRVAVLIGVEGGHTIENSLETLAEFHDRGARCLGLTHTEANDWADSATDEPRHGGLTPFGESVVREMNRLGMLVDLAHTSVDTMHHVLRVSKAPVIFSHASTYTVAPHPRNVPDDVLRQLAKNRGLIMVAFLSAYLHPEGAKATEDYFVQQRVFKERYPDPAEYEKAWKAWREAHPIPAGTVADVVDHIDHVVRLCGVDHVGLGSDFDGARQWPVQLEDVSGYPRITQELLNRGYSEFDIRKILGGNLLRVMREVERVAREWKPEPMTEGGRHFEGRYFRGSGDVEFLELLDIARRMFEPDPEFQNLPMLYTPAWNGFVEGPTWDAWWIQNSYGPTYCGLPFWEEPYTTFIQNSQDLWFDQMGDGRRKGAHDWVAPDGGLCDAASPDRVIYKQGDGRIDIHDWGMEFTAAGVVLQSELLLIERDAEAIRRYLPKLERCANFIETRRGPENNLFLAGPAGNLLAPSYAGYRQPDGTYGKAYLAGLSITYIAALDRLIELEKLAGRAEQAELYRQRRDLARKGLPALMTEEGYFIKSLDPDGTKHGVYGAARHGYFEAVCNHDAMCFRVADDKQCRRIYDKIASIPGLRPYDFIITNFPALDDMYQEQTSIWKFGHWVNGGAWSTCEARMIMGYYRVGAFEDARRSMQKMLTYARRFRMDNPLIDFGNDVYQPHVPINCVYDNWGVPAAMIRGLFEYLYTAGGVRIIPHIPPGITRLEQKFPIRLGKRRLYLRTAGTGPVTAVRVNGRPWTRFDQTSVFLPDDDLPSSARVEILLGQEEFPDPAAPAEVPGPQSQELTESAPQAERIPPRHAAPLQRISRLYARLVEHGLSDSYEARHARLVLDCARAAVERQQMLDDGRLEPLAEEASQTAADQSYMDTVIRLAQGLGKVLDSYNGLEDPPKQRIFNMWRASR